MSENSARPRTIAFYLPQFHRIAENDAWWGDGFTEWTNVTRARPAFDGHDQPRVPTELDYYDLSDPSVMHEQTELARSNDVDAFCFYFYWFGGKRLLERPLDDFLASGPDMPFCLSWANESWTRRWDGKDREVLIEQRYDANAIDAAFEALLPYLRDPRYLRVNGGAVVLVHRAEAIPDPRGLASSWRTQAARAGIGPLHLVATETVQGIRPDDLGFDAVAEFPPVGANTLSSAWQKPLRGLAKGFRGRLLSYERIARNFSSRTAADYVRYSGVMPGWDNSARRGRNATIYVGSSPARYSEWLASARMREQRLRGANGLVFINAWNEWAEGAYLEPDATFGNAYLSATRWDPPEILPLPRALQTGAYSASMVGSLLRVSGSSVLRLARGARRRATAIWGIWFR